MTQYTYRMRAKNAGGPSPYSNTTTQTTGPAGPLLIVPGGQGFGMETRGPYDGSATPTIVKVTTLVDTVPGVPGTARYAFEEVHTPRIIIPEVSGYIDMLDTIRISDPYIRFDGQTAPGPICFRKYGFECTTHDVLLQHFAIRNGAWGIGKLDNCNFIGFGANMQHIVLSQMSVGWSIDENLCFFSDVFTDLNSCFWRCLVTEGLDEAPEVPPGAGYDSHAILFGARTSGVSMIQNGMVSCRVRNPYAQSDCSYVSINNLTYNWYGPWSNFLANFDISGNPGAGGPWAVSMVENLLIPGPGSTTAIDSPNCYGAYYDNPNAPGPAPAGNAIYRLNNTLKNPLGKSFVAEGNELAYNPNVGSPPARAPINIFPTPLNSADAGFENYILTRVGERPAARNAIDQRVINYINARTGPPTGNSFVKVQGDVGGYPAMPNLNVPVSVPANPHDVMPSGYTRIEEWLHSLAALVEVP